MPKKKTKKKTKKNSPKKKVVKRKVKKVVRHAYRQAGKTKKQGPPVVGELEHFFAKIFVAALKLKTPLKVGDVIHIKGATTDFTQKIESMQIDHKDVVGAKRGQDVGFRVRSKCRVGDTIFMVPVVKEQLALPKVVVPQQSFLKPQAKPKPKPVIKPPAKSSPYSNTKFLSF